MFKLALLSILMNYFFFFHYVTNFNVNSSLNARIRSVFQENTVRGFPWRLRSWLLDGYGFRTECVDFSDPLAWQGLVPDEVCDSGVKIGQPRGEVAGPVPEEAGDSVRAGEHAHARASNRGSCRPRGPDHFPCYKGNNCLQNR